MTNSDSYKKHLQEELVLITAELKELGIHNPQVEEDWIPLPEKHEINEADENVSADRSEDLEERTATLSELETRFNNIKRALVKIEEGTYGICEVCGNEIEEDRLIANSSARTCIAHKEEELSLT